MVSQPTTGNLAWTLAALLLLALALGLDVLAFTRQRRAARLIGRLLTLAAVLVNLGVIVSRNLIAGRNCPVQTNYDSALLFVFILGGVLFHMVVTSVSRPASSAGRPAKANRPAVDLILLPLMILIQLLAAGFCFGGFHEFKFAGLRAMHLATLILSSALMAMAAIAGVMYLLLDRALRRKAPGGLPGGPSLEKLESLTRNAELVGFALLTLAILSGVMVVLHQQVPHVLLVHWVKLYPAMAAWAVYLISLNARFLPRYRGRPVAWLNIVGFLLLLTTYVLAELQRTPGEGEPMRILLAGCNHKTAPLEIRERIAFDAESADRAIKDLTRQFPQTEVVLLNTCNRVEFYVARPAHRPPQPAEIVQFIAQFHRLPAEQLAGVIYQRGDRDAVEHLMQVAGSLDSMVLGETQILGQVREAFRQAQSAGTVGPVLSRLCQESLAAAKRVHAETGLSTGRLSIASVAAQFARQIFSDLADKTVLIVGAGKMGELVLGRLIELGPKQVLVANRSRPRAEDLAVRYRGEVLDLAQLADALTRADVVITSTGSPTPLIGPAMMNAVVKARRFRPIFLIDIAVPRDVEPEVGRIQHVYLYNIDDLQRVVEATAGERAGRVADAQAILRQQADQFMAWLRARSLGPTIAAFCKRLADLRAEELDWLSPKLTGASERDRELIEQMTHRLINKVMHDPVRELTESCGPEAAAADVYAQALIRLFNLEIEEEEESKGNAAAEKPPAPETQSAPETRP